LCEQPTPATTTASVPYDCGPWTDVHLEESTDLRPERRWHMPVCYQHAAYMIELVTCARCRVELPRADSIGNGSTVELCRPCNAKENG